MLFLLIHLAPGDPVSAFTGEVPVAPEFVQELRHQLGLDRSLAEQFLLYLAQLARGDLGYSYYYNQPVLTLILERVPATALLMSTGLIAAPIIGVVPGAAAPAQPQSCSD